MIDDRIEKASFIQQLGDKILELYIWPWIRTQAHIRRSHLKTVQIRALI